MVGALRAQYVPNKVVLFRPEGESPDIAQIAPFAQHQQSLDGRATAYVCRNHNCEFPTTEPQRMLDLLHAQE